MPKFSWINSLQVFLLLSSSLFLLYGSTGWASPVIRGEPTVEEKFQISDVVFRGRVLRVKEVKHSKEHYKESATSTQDELETQRGSDKPPVSGECEK